MGQCVEWPDCRAETHLELPQAQTDWRIAAGRPWRRVTRLRRRSQPPAILIFWERRSSDRRPGRGLFGAGPLAGRNVPVAGGARPAPARAVLAQLAWPPRRRRWLHAPPRG